VDVPVPGDDDLSFDLRPDAPSLVDVRRWMATILADAPEEFRFDAMLIGTELVSNAYDHARGPRAIRVCRPADGRVVRIEVDDGSPRDHPVLGRSRINDSRGRGLVLVAQLAQRWGEELHARGKTVWAELTMA
jgi:hypothetical protein